MYPKKEQVSPLYIQIIPKYFYIICIINSDISASIISSINETTLLTLKLLQLYLSTAGVDSYFFLSNSSSKSKGGAKTHDFSSFSPSGSSSWSYWILIYSVLTI